MLHVANVARLRTRAARGALTQLSLLPTSLFLALHLELLLLLFVTKRLSAWHVRINQKKKTMRMREEDVSFLVRLIFTLVKFLRYSRGLFYVGG